MKRETKRMERKKRGGRLRGWGGRKEDGEED